MLLQGKKAIVTGGTRGIGFAVVQTFLRNGASVALFGSRQETVDKALADAGHEVMSHSNHHDHYNSLSTQQIIDDVTASNQRISASTGVTPTLIRCPYGEYDDHVIAAIRSMGMEPIQWDVDSLDWKDYDAATIIRRVTEHKHLGNGSIILCHNGAKHTAEALDELITILKQKGFTFVPISELIIRENYHMDVAGKQIADET